MRPAATAVGRARRAGNDCARAGRGRLPPAVPKASISGRLAVIQSRDLHPDHTALIERTVRGWAERIGYPLQAFFRGVMPLVRPALLAVALFAITQSWNEFLYAYTFLRSTEVFTLPVGLAQLIVGDVQPWGVLMAASLLTAMPVVVIYMLGQRFMVAGLTAGSVKG